MNKEIINQLKSTKTVDELKDLASKNGYTLNSEEANGYFDLFHAKGKVADNELDNVSGGACSLSRNGKFYSGDGNHELIVTLGNVCDSYKKPSVPGLGMGKNCGNCVHMFNDAKRNPLSVYCKIRTWDDDPLNPCFIK